MSVRRSVVRACLIVACNGVIGTASAGGPDYPVAVTPGIYVGIGGSLNLEYLSVNTAANYLDANSNPVETTANLKNKQIDGAPIAQVGYWGKIGEESLWGMVTEYKYLNYTLGNINGVNTIAFPNLSSLPGYGDLSVNISNEFMLLLYFGATYRSGFFYVGVGPVLFTLRDSIRNYNQISEGTNFVGMAGDETLWGGAAQVGYNYFFRPTWFLGVNYTYTISGSFTLQNNRSNWDYWYYDGDAAAITATNMHLTRQYNFTAQEFMCTLNKIFAV